MCHPAQLPIAQLLTQCEIQRTRGSGPGGQHRNKVETAIAVQHLPTRVRALASERRSQEQNRQRAIFRLRLKLALEVRREPAAAVSSRWRQRAANGRISVSTTHDDFPALLAEALDVIDDCGYCLVAAAHRLGVSTSQLVKFLKAEPLAFAGFNRQRQARDKRPLR